MCSSRNFIQGRHLQLRQQSRKRCVRHSFLWVFKIWTFPFPHSLNFNNNWIIINFHKIPLFGLQHILFPLRPEKGSAHEFAYQILSAVSISLQGCIVSVLFCFANHEVISAVKIYFNSICPWLFKNQNPETYNVAPSTTKDIMVWEHLRQEFEMIDYIAW